MTANTNSNNNHSSTTPSSSNNSTAPILTIPHRHNFATKEEMERRASQKNEAAQQALFKSKRIHISRISTKESQGTIRSRRKQFMVFKDRKKKSKLEEWKKE